MKWFLILLFVPCLSFCQTVHTEDGRVVYKGVIKTGSSFEQLHNVIEKALKTTGSKNEGWSEDSSSNAIIVNAAMKLKSDLSTINQLQFQLKLTKKDEEYHYHIDSVKLVQRERGYKTTAVSSEELIKNLDNTGTVATATEKELNEIDMRLEQLVDLLRNYSK